MATKSESTTKGRGGYHMDAKLRIIRASGVDKVVQFTTHAKADAFAKRALVQGDYRKAWHVEADGKQVAVKVTAADRKAMAKPAPKG